MRSLGEWRVASAAAMVLALASGCSSDSSNPNPTSDLAQEAAALFPAGTTRDEATTLITTLENAAAGGSAADAAAFDLATLSLDEYAAGRLTGTAAAQRTGLSDFLTDVFAEAGLPDPQLSPESFGTDGVVAVVDAAGGEFVTQTLHAGITIPAGALSREVLLVVERLPDSSQYAPGAGPLPTTLNQYPLFYEFTTTPAATFASDAILGLCQVTESASAYYAPAPVYDRLQIAHPDPANPGTIELLPRVAAPFLDCDGVTASGSRANILLARRAGIGGRVRKFSPFGAVDPEPGPPPDQFSITYCSAADAPIWVAQQDGNGAWQRVQPAQGTSMYTFSFRSGRGGIATVFDYGTGGINAAFSYATLAEQRQNVAFLNNYCGNKTVNGSVAGVGASQFAAMHLGFDEDLAGGTAGDDLFQLQNVPLGPRDLVAALHDDATERVNRFVLRRGVNAPDNSTLPVIDFSAAESFAPASATATVTGLAGDVAGVFTGLGTFYYPRLSQFSLDVSTSVPYDALPAAQLAPGDVQRLVGYTQNCCEPESRTVDVYFRNVVDRTLAFGPTAAIPTISTVTGSSFARPRIQMPVQPEYNRSIEAFFSQGTGASERSAYYRASSDYYATAPTTWDMTYPDVSGVAGFNTAWTLQAGASTSWTVFVFGGDFLPFEDATLPADGDAYRTAYREGGPFTALRKATSGDASMAPRGFGRAPLGVKR